MKSKGKLFAVLLAIVMMVSLFSPLQLNHYVVRAEDGITETLETLDVASESEALAEPLSEVTELPTVMTEPPAIEETEPPAIEETEPPAIEETEPPAIEETQVEELPSEPLATEQESSLPEASDAAAVSEEAEAESQSLIAPMALGDVTLTVGGVTTPYDTFDAAIAAFNAQTSAGVIDLISDTHTSAGFTVTKSLEIKSAAGAIVASSGAVQFFGNSTYTVNKVNIDITGATLHIGRVANENVSLTINDSEWTASGAGGFGVVMTGATVANTVALSLNRSSLFIDGAGNSGFYTDKARINVTLNSSDLTVQNSARGLVAGAPGQLYVTTDASTLNSIDNRGNGSNGGYFSFNAGSTVDFSNNGGHGLSVTTLTVANSKVTANSNAYQGIILPTGAMNVTSNSVVTASLNRGTLGTSAGMYLGGTATSNVDATSTLNLTENLVPGLHVNGATLNVAAGAVVNITLNNAQNTGTADYRNGGGVLVRGGGSVTFPANAAIHNNLATNAGDDIFVDAASHVTIGLATSTLLLVDPPYDGQHMITGWFDDAAGSRWSAHTDPQHMVEVLPATLSGVALKAAHGIEPVDFTFGFTKEIAGRDWLGTDEFSFSTRVYNALTPGSLLFNRSTVVSLAGGVSREYTVTFTEPGDYVVYIREAVRGSVPIPRMEYDTNRTINVSVTLDATGQLVATTDDEYENVIFTNVYTPFPFEFDVTFSKVLVGRDWLDTDAFSFSIVGRNAAGQQVYSRSTVVTKDNLERAYTIALTEPGVYDFTVSERVRGDLPIPGVEYDTLRQFTVTVSNDGSLSLAGEIEGQYQDLVFTNTYSVEPVSFEVPFQKILEGREWLSTDGFYISLNGVLAETGEQVWSQSMYVQDGEEKTFMPTIDAPGTYTFTLWEAVGEIPGITYATNNYVFTVEVTDNLDGTMTATIVDELAFPLSFTNTYVATPFEFEVEFDKELVGRNWLEDDIFYFTLTGVDGEGTQVYSRSITTTTGEPMTLGPVSLSEAGVYEFTLWEATGDLPGITYDDTKHVFTVTVEDNLVGQLVGVIEGLPEAIVFTNTYAATGKWTPVVSKVLAGRTLGLEEFSFELKLGEEVLQTVANFANGEIPFESIAYTEADAGQTFTYTVTELVPEAAEEGMTYDSLVVTFEVTVVDNGDGTLTATAADVADTTFNNMYEAENGLVFEAEKILTGRDLAADEFEFELKDEEGVVLQTVTNAVDGSIAFDNILYTQDDIGATFVYTIEEVAGTEAGMTYSDLVVTVTVTVTDAGQGVLDLDVSLDADAIFENSYEATGSIELVGSKVLNGRDLAADEFEFELLDAEGNVLQTVKNLVDGTIAFAPLTFTEANIGETIALQVREIEGTDGNVVYDPTVYDIELLVEDAGDGVLTVTLVEDTAVEFTNTWLTLQVKATKTWVGGPAEKPVIWFKLQRGVPGGLFEDVADAAILKLDGIVEVTWTDLAVKDENGIGYVYRVLEVDEQGNGLTLANYKKVEEGLNVTNTYVEPVKPEVPKTGEARTLPFAGLGLLLAAAGVAFLRRRREEF